MPINRNERLQLLDEYHRVFDIEMLWFHQLCFQGYRDDVSVHGWFSPDCSVTPELRLETRRWFSAKNWQFSRQFVKVLGRHVERLYLCPMKHVAIDRGFHATRSASVRSIMATGLLPSTSEFQTTDNRLDCEGNIYLCERLGTPNDEGIPCTHSAHWWRHHLAGCNRFADPNWVILEIKLDSLEGRRLYCDIWSESGIILDGVSSIPPSYIREIAPRLP